MTTQLNPQSGRVPARGAVEEWLDELAQIGGRRPNTIESHRQHITAALEDIGGALGVTVDDLDLEQVTRKMLTDAIIRYRNRPDRRYTATTAPPSTATRASESVRRRTGTIRVFFRWAADVGYISGNPARNIPMPPVPDPLPIPLDGDQLDALFDACDRAPWPAREHAMVWCALGGGLRLDEIATLDLDNLTEDLTMAAVLGKGGRQRNAALLAPATAALATYLPERAAKLTAAGITTRRLFLTIHPRKVRGITGIDGQPIYGHDLARSGMAAAFTRLFRDAGIQDPKTGQGEGLRTHSLRHTYATLALAGRSHTMRQLQEQLGHRTLEMITRYTRVAATDLREAAGRHPLAGNNTNPS